MKTFVASFLLIMLHFSTHVSASEPRPGSITTLELNKIKNIKSDPFIMSGVTIERGELKIQVSYSAGYKGYDF